MVDDILKNLAITAPRSDSLRDAVQAHLNDLTKPQGSLGRLEELALRYCQCRGKADSSIDRMKLVTFAGDHGIAAERITPYPPEVTSQMVLNMASGGAAVSVMCRQAGIEYAVVDVGVASDLPDLPGLHRCKVAPGTASFLDGEAMTDEQLEAAIATGMGFGREENIDLFGAGEMGIANSASASALYSLLLGVDPAETVGPGTGSQGEVLERKRRVIARAVARHKEVWDGSATDALRRVGGLEIAAMVGLILGAAQRRVPVVVDGFIATAAALGATRMVPAAADYIIYSHASAETFHKAFLAGENIRPLLDLEMRLGEGTGAVLAMQIVAQALACYNRMATFSSAGVSTGAS